MFIESNTTQNFKLRRSDMYLQISFENDLYTCRPAGAFSQQEAIYLQTYRPYGAESASYFLFPRF